MSVVALRIWKEGIICKGPVISVDLSLLVLCLFFFNFFFFKDIRSVDSYLKQMY